MAILFFGLNAKLTSPLEKNEVPNDDSLNLAAEAFELLGRCLDLLDQTVAPADIGAHVDLARDRLSQWLSLNRLSRSIAVETVFEGRC